MILVVKDISKFYPGEDLGAVSKVSFQVNSGEIVSIIGESGSGKTTLLRMVAGLMKPDSGEITFDGESLSNPEEQLIAGHDAIKMVFQDYDLMPNMTVRENIAYKLLGYESRFREERINHLLTLCGLEELGERKPRALSGGQQQRLSLARALADEPKLLLMDEPFSNLDPISKQKLLLEVHHISKKEGVALIFVTHDTQDALMISDRIGYIEAGQLIQMDTPEILYKNPVRIEVARFLGLLNEFTALEWAELGLSAISGKAGIFALRAEDIKLHETGEVNVIIDSCRFLGKEYLIKAKLENGKIIVLYSDQVIEPGEVTHIKILDNKAIHFA